MTQDNELIEELCEMIAAVIDNASPRNDPSPIGMGKSIAYGVHAAGLCSYESSKRAIDLVSQGGCTGYGDWCGGRVEPEVVAAFMAARLEP